MSRSTTDDADPTVLATTPRTRYDKWLWAARFYKTRSLAAQAIEAGQARLSDARVKPAHAVRAANECRSAWGLIPNRVLHSAT
jgi:ribosomal 50S subunit-recycling heat shock protein